MKKVIPILTEEARLKRAVRRHLKKIGFASVAGRLVYNAEYSKEQIRSLHASQRSEKLAASKSLVARWDFFKEYFASGVDVNPSAIRPRLELIETRSWQSDLFAFASLYWSVPTSSGYGRRLRFLCWDDSNGKLIGLVALGDPVFNLSVRDQFVGWSGRDRVKRLSSVMDAYVLGALPPYNELLCGKLLACILKSTEVFGYFHDKYFNYRSIISGKKRHAQLAVITTSSALGRSAVYNRLRIGDETFFRSVGVTKGFGHFHIPNGLFMELREYLSNCGHEYADGHGYGKGANWRMRVIRESFAQLGLPAQTLKHGISREVFLCEMGSNSLEYLRGSAAQLDTSALQSVDDLANAALQRWVIPRSERRQHYRNWDRASLIHDIKYTKAMPPQLLRVAR